MTSGDFPFLVDTAWLEQHLHDLDLRVLDCTVYLPNYFDESAGKGISIVPGREDFERGHIPGSAYVDLAGELTDRDNKR
ncbi:MAG: sulfurtransferase, partial [Acidobacteria bacterium]|nr:sulfurtransferase [Acidobacteriota bacterium]